MILKEVLLSANRNLKWTVLSENFKRKMRKSAEDDSQALIHILAITASLFFQRTPPTAQLHRILPLTAYSCPLTPHYSQLDTATNSNSKLPCALETNISIIKNLQKKNYIFDIMTHVISKTTTITYFSYYNNQFSYNILHRNINIPSYLIYLDLNK